MGVRVAKAHAYGNDFLLVAEGAARTITAHDDRSALARMLCDRHCGKIGRAHV